MTASTLTSPPAVEPTPVRTPQTAVAPLNTFHEADIGAASAKLDSWLRKHTGNYVTLERLTMVAGSVPAIGNVMALLDVLGDMVTIVDRVIVGKPVELFDWVSLGVDLIGVIPLPGTAAARMTLRPTVHAVREEFRMGAKNLGEATIVMLTANLNDKLMGELDNFVQGALDRLETVLGQAADVADHLLDSLIHLLKAAVGDEHLFDIAKAVPPETELHNSQVVSTWNRLLSAAVRMELEVANEVADRGAKLLPKQLKDHVLTLAHSLGDVKLQFRKNLVQLADQKVQQSISHLLHFLLQNVTGRLKKRSVIVPANKGVRVVDERSGNPVEHQNTQARAHADAGPCKQCPAPSGSHGSISFATGAESFSHTDFVLPAPLPIEWKRTYRSHATAFDQGVLGARWLTPFSSRIDIVGQGRRRSLVHHGADGRPHAYPWLEVGQSHRDSVEEVTLTRTDEGRIQLDFGKPQAPGPNPEPNAWREHYEVTTTAAGTQHFRLTALQGKDGVGIGLRYDHRVVGEEVLSDILSKQGDTTFAHLGIKPDPKGRIESLWEMKDGQLLRQVAGYTYDKEGDLVVAHDENAAARGYQYRNHLVTRYTDRTGRGNNLQYDHYGDRDGLPRAIREWSDDGSLDTRLEWDANIRLTYITDALGAEMRVYYDIAGYTYRVVHPDGLQEWFFRDDDKNVIRHIHTDGATDAYRYDRYGNLIRHLRADASEIHFQYDSDHRITGILDPDGGRWKRDYDNHGHMVEETDPLGHKTEHAYDKAGRVVEITDAKGGKKKLAYTASGELASYTDCSGRKTAWEYDARGRMVKRTDALGNATVLRFTPVTQAALDMAGRRDTSYDPLCSFPGQLESIERPDKTIERFARDAEGRLLEHSDALNRRTAFSYNAAGRIAERTDAEGYKLGYQWDKLGRLATLRNENGQPYTFKYDPVGRLLEETGFDGKATTYRYLPSSGVLAEVVDGGVATHLDFDPMGRLAKRQAAVAAQEQTETFAYYPSGLLGEAANEHARLQYFYDDAGNLTRENHVYLKLGKTAVWRHRYDELSQRIGTTRPDGHTTEWLTYGSGHVHGLMLDGKEVAAFERDALHREVHRGQSNGIEQTQRFDPVGRLLQQSLAHRETKPQNDDAWDRLAYDGYMDPTSQLSARPVIRRDYRYSKNGELVGIADTRRGGLGYRYDAVGRLLAAGGNTGAGGERETFEFDPAGNILPVAPPNVDTRSREVKAALPKVLDNLIKQYAGTTYDWDDRGNLIERKQNGQSTEFKWDAFNRMTEAKSDRWSARFAYDPFGRRIAKWSHERRPESEGLTSTATEILYGWDGDVLAFESNGGNQRNGYRGDSIHYIHEAGSFVPLLQARSPRPIELNPTTDMAALKAANFGEYDHKKDPLWNGDLDPQPQRFQPYDIAFYQCDHLGTPMEMTDHDGKVAWEAHYKAWGMAKEVMTEAGKRAGFKNAIRFQGQYFDEETGLHYNRFRYYDPQVGRFAQSDPIGLAGGINSYLYANANPLMYVDPNGLWGVADLPSIPQPVLDFTTGVADAASLGLGPLARQWLDVDGGVDRCSKAYSAGEWASLGLGAGRMAYAGIAKVGAAAAADGAAAMAFRNGLKRVMRGPLAGSSYRIKTYEDLMARYGSDAAIQAAAGRTNRAINAVGADLGIGGAVGAATCGCP